MCVCVCSVVSDSAIPRTVARQAPLSVEFSRQEYWSGCHFLLQGIFPTQGLNPFLLQIYCIGRQDSLLTVPPRKPSKKFLPPAVPRGLEFSVKLSMGFSRQQCWSGLPCPPPRALPNSGIKVASLHWQAGSSPLAAPAKHGDGTYAGY